MADYPAPVLDVKNLFRDNWEPAQVPSLPDEPEFSTGKWSTSHSFPAVVVHSADEDVQSPGQTGYSAMHGAGGGGVQVRDGMLQIALVAGRRGDLSENPKKVRKDMKNHALDLLVDQSNWPATYESIAPRAFVDAELTTDEEDPGPVYYMDGRAAYEWILRPTV